MTWPIVAVVALQVVLFQLAYCRLARALPGILIGDRELPPDVEVEVGHFRATAGGWRVAAGAGMLSALASTVAMGAPASAVKLVAAAVSLMSSALLLAGYVRDRRVVSRLAARVPAPAIRAATVSRPALRDLYPPLWEGVVLVVWIACMVPVVSGLLATARAWPFLALGLAQALAAVGGLWFSAWYARSGARLPQRARVRLGLELATEVDRSLRRAELRALLASRIGILLLLGLNAVRATASGETHRLLDAALWVIIAALLVVFGVYVVAATRTTTRAGIDQPAGSVRRSARSLNSERRH